MLKPIMSTILLLTDFECTKFIRHDLFMVAIIKINAKTSSKFKAEL